MSTAHAKLLPTGCGLLAAWVVSAPGLAVAGDPDGASLDTVIVTATGMSAMSAASAGDVTRQLISDQPLLRPAAMLENVPGLIVTQHSGEGKANQYFLRGFNLDHGTDLAVEVDDMPVNMPSHAHGQGYADLNFLIPELSADLHYKKGAYYADQGDFATAGTVRVGLVDSLPSGVSLGAGEDGYRRTLFVGSAAAAGGTLLAAGELYRNDGPFAVPDDYRRLNAELRYHRGDDQDGFSVTGMAYSGRWNATDQIPEGGIASGAVARFGSLNPSDGGASERSSVSVSRVLRTADGESQLSAYLIRYRLDLWSTFTYYLKDPLNGDQMLQHDERTIYGVRASKRWFTDLGGAAMTNLLGAQLRADDIQDVGIFPTVQRRIVGTTQDASVVESSGAVYFENSLTWRRWLRTVAGMRADGFNFQVDDKMRGADGSCTVRSDPLGCNSGTRRAALVSPKFGLVLGPWGSTTYFINAGDGYHSNDARGVTRSGGNPDAAAVTPLTRARSAEVGVRSQLLPYWDSSLDVFRLKLRSELTFDGDAGVTVPGGSTTRTGIEWSNALHFSPWLSAQLDAAFTRTRYDRPSAADDLGCSEAAAGHPCLQSIAVSGRYVPNSPSGVIDAALVARRPSGWFASLRARHIGESPLVADNSARSPAYTTLDAQFGFQSPNNWRLAVEVFNLANVKWDDIEYYYVSRLKSQAAAVPDTTVHPGVPRTLRAHLEYRF